MMDSNIDISIIIPVYNNQFELKLTLDSICDQSLSRKKYEVIIVDDGSQPEMRDFVENLMTDYFWIRYYFQEDKGFRPGTARNIGIQKARGKICLFIDCGVLLEKSCLENHIRIHDRGYDVALGYVYGMNMNKVPDMELMRKSIHSYDVGTAITVLEKNGIDDSRAPLYEEHGDDLTKWPIPWVVLWSVHFSVITEFLRKNNILFDTYFNTWGGEDNDFGINLDNHGARFILCRSAKSIHYPPDKTSYQRIQTEPGFRNDLRKNQKYILDKYPNNKGVRLWDEKGMFHANRAYLESSEQ